MVVRADIGRSTGRFPPEPAIQLSGMAILHFLLLLEFILADKLADLPPKLSRDYVIWMLELILTDQLADVPQDCHLVVKNGNFTCLSTVRVHIGRSTCRYIFYIRTSGHSCNYDTT